MRLSCEHIEGRKDAPRDESRAGGSVARAVRLQEHQVEVLERAFSDGQTRIHERAKRSLSDALGCDAKVISTWFQNKRQRVKAERKKEVHAQLVNESIALKAELAREEKRWTAAKSEGDRLLADLAQTKGNYEQMKQIASKILNEYYSKDGRGLANEFSDLLTDVKHGVRWAGKDQQEGQE